jgi:hypothetical protein
MSWPGQLRLGRGSGGLIGDLGAVLIVDETGFIKKGEVGGGAAAGLRHGSADGELPDRGLLAFASAKGRALN